MSLSRLVQEARETREDTEQGKLTDCIDQIESEY